MKKNVTIQLPHSLVVHPLLRKILDPPLFEDHFYLSNYEIVDVDIHSKRKKKERNFIEVSSLLALEH